MKLAVIGGGAKSAAIAAKARALGAGGRRPRGIEPGNLLVLAR
jgi:hypothetical protein